MVTHKGEGFRALLLGYRKKQLPNATLFQKGNVTGDSVMEGIHTPSLRYRIEIFLRRPHFFSCNKVSIKE